MNRLPLSFYLQAILCAALWGSAFPVIKLSYMYLRLDGYGEKLLFAGTRFTLAGLVVMLVCGPRIWRGVVESPKGLLMGVTLGQTFGQYIFFYYGMSVSSGALGSLLNGTGSLMWVLLAPLFLKTAFPTAKQWVALAICLIGISIAVYAPGVGSGNVTHGVIAFSCVGLSGAFGAIFMKQIAPLVGAREVTALSLFIGGLMLCVAGSYETGPFLADYSWRILGVPVYLAVLSATAFTVWNRLIQLYSVNVMSAFRFLIPLCGVIESALFLKNETLGIGIVVGGSILIGSLYMMGRLEEQAK
ncbi:MAG: DMT family transporter [Opitutales bacterium]|nr:DMT family transporter [Opitutales bacterium]